jgi:hypothetical protein
MTYQNLDRCTPNEKTLREIANALLGHAGDIEVLCPFQANAMRNMAAVLDPK